MSSSVNLQTVGLYSEPNPLTVPEGALSDATNVNIQRDNTIEPRRGFSLFGTTFGTSTDRLSQLFVYKFRLLRQYQDVIEFDTGTINNAGEELFQAFSGSFAQAQPGLRTKSVESNGNFYFTSNAGIKKISASNANQFTTATGFVTQAGGIKALDVSATPIITQANITGFLPQDSTVAYRVVWGINDNNKNLILGVPSQRAEVFLSLNTLLIVDFNKLIQEIQNTANQPSPNNSIINESDYVSSLTLSSSATSQDIQTNLLALTAKLDNDILIANDTGTGAPLTISSIVITNNTSSPTQNSCNITFSSGNPSNYWVSGNNIFLTGFPLAENGLSINGLQVITSVTSSTITFTTAATGNVKTFTGSNVDTPNDLINLTNHGFKNFDPVQFTTTGTLPNPLVPSTTYYIGNVTPDTFQVYTDPALSTIVNFSGSTGTGTNTITFIMPITGTSINSGEFRSINETFIDSNGNKISVLETNVIDEPATDGQLVALQNFIKQIISKLQTFLTTGTPPIISAFSKLAYIDILNVTTSANVKLDITIPKEVTPDYFFQIYRSPITQATGTTPLSDLFPSDELQQVYEAFPTAAELSAGTLSVIDIVPDAFLGADLYTNQASGVGIANANEPPPFALDVAKFKNTVFYANTRTKFRMSLNLIGVANMVTDYQNGITPKLVISDGITTNEYSFVLGVQQITHVTTVADVADSLNGKYFLLNSANNANQYYIWYKTSGGTESDPMVANRTGIEVFIDTNASANDVAKLTSQTINTIVTLDFSSVNVSAPSPNIRITNTAEGSATNASAGTSGFTVTTPTPGVGEDVAMKQVLLSNKTSPAEAIDETAKSLVNVINRNSSETIYAFYLSQASTVPGEMTLESRNLLTPKYYLLANNSNTGGSFSPNLSPTITITSITTGAPGINVVTTVTPHGLETGDQVMISNTDSTPVADGLFTITYLSPTTFSINDTITVAATQGSMIASVDANGGDDEAKINRIYFSTLQEPESVPLPNTIDVGDEDKPIYRIFPVRDSLFVFKEDGLFRISGETAPFSLQLFDTSCILIAPDSVAITKNVIYAWTTQGILNITEAGVSNPPISRPIDVNILPLISNNYPHFTTSTWGVGYDSDNCYILFTVSNPSDTEATIAYRYNNITNTWTTWNKSDTCGIVNKTDDKLYFGSGTTNSMEQERKTFTRFDYADEELFTTLTDGQYIGNTIRLPDVSKYAAGDVLIQKQSVNVYTYNALLEKLDIDPGLQSNLISAISTGLTPTVTTIGNHNLSDGDFVTISGTLTIPSINGIFKITYINPTQFSISVPLAITSGGTSGLVKYNYFNTLGISAGADFEAAFNLLTARLNIEPSLIYKQDTVSITSNSIANPTVLSLASLHTLGPVGTIRRIRISGNTGSTPSINGDFDATVLTSTTLSIPVNVTVGGTGGSLTTLDDYITATSPISGSITNISVKNPTVVTAPQNGFVSNRYIHIAGSNSSPIIDGNYNISTVTTNAFTVLVNVLIAGNAGSYSTVDGSFQDMLVNYNYVISLLNKDTGTTFRNYSPISETTSMETIILDVNQASRQIIIENAIDFIVGPLSIFKAINSSFTYSPVTFKDPLGLKQVSEATLMFENKAFSQATLSFSSDLVPQFYDVHFRGNGNGGFGIGSGLFGANFFGGNANAAPFRTYIPRNTQRCRYIVPKFTHNVAFEKYSINGLTLSGNISQSPRAYR